MAAPRPSGPVRFALPWLLCGAAYLGPVSDLRPGAAGSDAGQVTDAGPVAPVCGFAYSGAARGTGAGPIVTVQRPAAGDTRTLEIDALLGSVVELARLTDTPTPHLDTVYALTKLLARNLEESKPLLTDLRTLPA